MKYTLKTTNMKFMNWKNIFRGTALIMLAVLTTHVAFAQGGPQGPGREKLESARIALITQRLSLDPETAQKFWPIYNQISEEEMILRREEMQMRRSINPDQVSNAQAQSRLDEYFLLKEKQLDLEKKAAEEYQDVLTPKQVLQLFKAEADFRRMVLEKMGERGRQGGGRRGGPPR